MRKVNIVLKVRAFGFQSKIGVVMGRGVLESLSVTPKLEFNELFEENSQQNFELTKLKPN